jgi:outer membrane protein TolC
MNASKARALLAFATTLLPVAARAADVPAAAPTLPAAPPAASAPAPGGRTVTVDEAVALAIQSNPALQNARLKHTVLDDNALSLRGRMLPVVALSEELQVYNHDFAITFPLGPAPVAFVARGQVTNTFVVALGQPLVGLLSLYENRRAIEITGDSLDETVKSGEDAIREAVQVGYLRYFEARATEDIARTSEAQLTEQRTVAESRVKAGVLTRADLLRLDVAAANARQQQIQAAAQQQVAKASLLSAMGLTLADGDVAFVEPQALEAVTATQLTEAEAQDRATRNRHESRAKLLSVESATHTADAKFYDLLPTVNLEAAYLNIQGQAFAEKNSAYVGVKASWNVWEWGASWYAYQAARADAQAAQSSVDDQTRSVQVDASTKLFLARSSASAVEVAEATSASAEESFRVSAELVKVGSATTTTELLDSQTALTQAKLNLVRARYEQAIAHVSLRRAVGEPR